MGLSDLFDRQSTRKQQHRLVNRDFPWLWAVRSSWFFEYHTIVVSNSPTIIGLDSLLRSSCTDTPQPEVWVVYHSGYEETQVGVIQIIPGKEDNRCWAKLIWEHIGTGKQIKHILFITPLIQDRLHFTICRLPKGEPSFNVRVSNLKQ